ncbi:P1 family peptidase [Lentibacillus sp. N15]|uniref:P1 family peptidase n=1 Tax=Lentibacillus songyuanensis TaxID=3136161 RepID=UPI0031BAE4DD
MKNISIEEIKGFHFGHTHNSEALTGCTVIICECGAVAGVDVRGGSPGTRETDVLKPENLVDEVHGVFLSGGSAFGLDVGGGMMAFLEEHDIGFDVQVARVPIVVGAILFDLYPGDPLVRPDKQMGYAACESAFKKEVFTEGSVGAGIGATVGKCCGYEHVMRGGIGVHAIEIGDLKIGAVVAVNAFGDIINPATNEILAGAYDKKKKAFLISEKQLQHQPQTTNRFSGNTTIGTIVTNAKLTKAEANKIASIGHDGFARTIRPSHTFIDGDTLFALSTNEVQTDLNLLSMLAVSVVEQAVMNAVLKADRAGSVPSSTGVRSH